MSAKGHATAKSHRGQWKSHEGFLHDFDEKCNVRTETLQFQQPSCRKHQTAASNHTNSFSEILKGV